MSQAQSNNVTGKIMDPAKDSNIQDTMPFTLAHQQFI